MSIKNEKDKKDKKNKEVLLSYDNSDIKKFEKKYKLKALTNKKDNLGNYIASKRFTKWLMKDKSHIVKKTVVELKNDDLYSNKTKNISYEKELTSNEIEKTLSDLIKEIQSTINNQEKTKELENKIKNLLTQNLENQTLPNYKNIEALDINAQNELLDDSENYIAFVYYFWSPETMNFKIIGLHSINALFEFVNIKQTFYLIKPAMITNDTPIYFCFDKIPYSISFNIKQDLIELTELFIKNGTTSDIFYYMEKNKTFIRVYGFNKIPLRIWLEFLLILGFSWMLEYVILFNYFWSNG